jgi:hypothetical protein
MDWQFSTITLRGRVRVFWICGFLSTGALFAIGDDDAHGGPGLEEMWESSLKGLEISRGAKILSILVE